MEEGQGKEQRIRDDRQEGVLDVQTCLEDDHSDRLGHHSDSADPGEAVVAFDDSEVEEGLGNDHDDHLDRRRRNEEADGSKDPDHWDDAAHRGCHDAARMILSPEGPDDNCGTHQACSFFGEKGEEKGPVHSFLSATWGTVSTVGGDLMMLFSSDLDRLARPSLPFSESHPRHHRVLPALSMMHLFAYPLFADTADRIFSPLHQLVASRPPCPKLKECLPHSFSSVMMLATQIHAILSKNERKSG